MLAVDIGNTFTRLVAFEGEDIRTRRSFRTKELDLYELEHAFAEAAALVGSGETWIASVAPDANSTVASAAERVNLERHFIKPGTDFIIPHDLKTPATTGVDRLLSAFAAGRRHYPGDAGRDGYVVAQCGSAATIDYIDGDGIFRGGYIIPGPTLWLSGLAEAAMLPDLSNELPDWKAVTAGDNTRDALLHGMHICLPTAVATATMMVNTSEYAPAGAEIRLPVVLTGGWGEAVGPYLSTPHVYDRDLLLHGIRLFAQRFQ